MYIQDILTYRGVFCDFQSYIHIYIVIYIYIYVCNIYMYVYAYICMYVNMPSEKCEYMYICMSLRVECFFSTYICMYGIHMYVCIIHIHTYSIYTYIYTCPRKNAKLCVGHITFVCSAFCCEWNVSFLHTYVCMLYIYVPASDRGGHGR